MNVTVVALGDSFSCGEGVGLNIRPEQTWAALLCAAFPAARLVNLSTAGARVRDVRRHQLPIAMAEQPHLATIMVGLNDVIRSGLCAEQVKLDMESLVGELHTRGATVLIARWHDPGAVLGLPVGLRRALGQRLAWVNDAVDAAAASASAANSPAATGSTSGPSSCPGPSRRRVAKVLTLDLARIPELSDPGAWAVDGVHPSPAGHRAIALSATRILAGSGLSGLRIPDAADLLPMPPGAGAARRTRWLLARGLPWLVQHSGRVAPAVLSMATQAIRDHQQRGARTSALSVGQWPAAREVGCLVGAAGGVGELNGIGADNRVGAVNGVGAQSVRCSLVAGVGQSPGRAEVARPAG